MPAPAARAREHPDMDFEPKMWGDAEFDGLGYEFDPVWFLTDEDRRWRRRSSTPASG